MTSPSDLPSTPISAGQFWQRRYLKVVTDFDKLENTSKFDVNTVVISGSTLCPQHWHTSKPSQLKSSGTFHVALLNSACDKQYKHN